MNNLCYEATYSFGLGTDGEQDQQYLENTGRNTSQDFWNIVPITLQFLIALPMCIYLKMPFCHDLLSSSKHFSHCFFSIFEEGEELNFLHPNFQKQNKQYLSFPYIAASFQANKATF